MTHKPRPAKKMLFVYLALSGAIALGACAKNSADPAPPVEKRGGQQTLLKEGPLKVSTPDLSHFNEWAVSDGSIRSAYQLYAWPESTGTTYRIQQLSLMTVGCLQNEVSFHLSWLDSEKNELKVVTDMTTVFSAEPGKTYYLKVAADLPATCMGVSMQFQVVALPPVVLPTPTPAPTPVPTPAPTPVPPQLPDEPGFQGMEDLLVGASLVLKAEEPKTPQIMKWLFYNALSDKKFRISASAGSASCSSGSPRQVLEWREINTDGSVGPETPVDSTFEAKLGHRYVLQWRLTNTANCYFVYRSLQITSSD